MDQPEPKPRPAISGVPNWVTVIVSLVVIVVATTWPQWIPWGRVAEVRRTSAAARRFVEAHESQLFSSLSDTKDLNLVAHRRGWRDPATGARMFLSLSGFVANDAEAHQLIHELERLCPPSPIRVRLLVGEPGLEQELEIEWLDGDPATNELADLK